MLKYLDTVAVLQPERQDHQSSDDQQQHDYLHECQGNLAQHSREAVYWYHSAVHLRPPFFDDFNQPAVIRFAALFHLHDSAG